eukprot:TRINITY_DN2279_c0_g1_i1.p1 TRINITY_DN2279_c0_g1~~TRINITY_DN2279_c0_g1_i1.p1  ORF type:complete len:162 (-),score=55.40 TRINITY_DN2279_c0_g1_i1:77-562(-)
MSDLTVMQAADRGELEWKKYKSQMSHRNTLRKAKVLMMNDNNNKGNAEEVSNNNNDNNLTNKKDKVVEALSVDNAFGGNNNDSGVFHDIELEEIVEVVNNKADAVVDGFELLLDQVPQKQEPEYVIQQKSIPKPVFGIVACVAGSLVFLVLAHFGKDLLGL